MDQLLDLYGDYFIIYALQNGYDHMLRSLGPDFRSFIQNLDSLHKNLEMSYKDMKAPSFRSVTLVHKAKQISCFR